jgi:hypothetical protein
MAKNKKAFLGVGGKPKFSQPDQQKHIDSVSKNIAILTGQTKNTKDRAVLVRDLMDFGLLDARGRFTGGGGTTIVGGGNNGGGIVNPDPEAPVKPINVRASAAFTTIMVQWDFPNYAGHKHAEIWRNTIDALGDMTDPRTEGEAVLVATVAGSMYMDSVLPETGYYYWVRFVNDDGLAGPVHSPSGVYAETLPDIDTVIEDFQQESLATLETFQQGFNSQIADMQQIMDDFDFTQKTILINEHGEEIEALATGLFEQVVTTENNYESWAAELYSLQTSFLQSDGTLTSSFINKMAQVLAGTNGMIAGEIATYNVTYGGNTYTLAEGIKVSVDINGEYTKQWGVQSEIGDLQHGVGFIDDNGKTTFMVSVDNFAVFNPVNGNWEAIFGVTDGRVIIKEAVVSDAIFNNIAVAFSATFENEVLVNGELTAWKLKGAQITGNALWMVNGNHSLAIEPDDFLAFWYGEAVYYNVETDTDNRSLGNAKFALMNNGRVLARGMELYDNDNNLMMDVNGLNGTYIKNLTVDTLKIREDAVTVPTYIETGFVVTAETWVEVLDYSFEEDFPINALFNFSVLCTRWGSDREKFDYVSLVMRIYENGNLIDSVSLPDMYAEDVRGKTLSHGLPLMGSANAPSGKVRVVVEARGEVPSQQYRFKLQGSITNAKR